MKMSRYNHGQLTPYQDEPLAEVDASVANLIFFFFNKFNTSPLGLFSVQLHDTLISSLKGNLTNTGYERQTPVNL